MRVFVWGMGCVGTVTAACLAEAGHDVVAIDPEAAKVHAINAGRSPVVEPGLSALVQAVVAAGRLRAVPDARSAGAWGAVALVCIGTPARADGSLALDQVTRVAEEIGAGLEQAGGYPVVVLRSTVFPGVTRAVLGPLLERHSGRQVGRDLGLVHNPEFLRAGSALADFREAPYTVIGALDRRAGDVVAELYGHRPGSTYRLAPEEAELLKLITNAFHGLKVGFANEVGRVCARLGLDSHRLMQLLCADTQLNLSPAYLRPGFAFGGPCLAKDLDCLTSQARRLGAALPILEAVLPSNRLQIEEVRSKIRQLGTHRVGVLGLGLKPGTDEVRSSPVVDLIRRLLEDGMKVLAYDPDLNGECLAGSSLDYLRAQLPGHHTILQSDLQAVLGSCDVVVVAQKRPEFAAALQACQIEGLRFTVLDLVRLDPPPGPPEAGPYLGLSW